MTALDRLVWAADGSFRIGETEVGIRTTSKPFANWLGSALARYRSDKATEPTYSVVIADGSDGDGMSKERYHILYKGTIAIAKTTDVRSLVHTLRSDLESYLFDDRNDAIFADMNVVSLGGINALVPGNIVPFIGTLGRRRLVRTGLSLPAETFVALEPGTRRVVPIQPGVELLDGWLEELAVAIPVDGSDPRAVLESPTAIDVIVSVGWGDEPVARVSKGLALYRLASHVANLELLGGEAVADLLPMVEQARCFEMASAKPAAMLDALLQVFQAA